MAMHSSGRRWAAAAAAAALVVAVGRGLTVRAAAGGGARPGLSPAATQDLVGRMRLSEHGDQLDGLRLMADEVWKSGERPGKIHLETDQVFFYRSVYIEATQSEQGKRLGASARAKQDKAARKLERRIDALGDVPAAAGRLVNLDGEIWTLDQIAARFQWTATDAGLVAGRPAVTLHFEPLAGLHAHSRVDRVLEAAAGNLTVDALSGQILRGDFRSLGEVRYGGGWLAHIAFQGEFRMQPAGHCWVMRDVTVRVQGRILFTSLNGTQNNTYRLATGVAGCGG